MRRGKNWPVSLAAGCVACLPLQLSADSFRCGTRLIKEGMAALEIKALCGEPSSVESVSEPIFARRADGTTYQVGVAMKEYWRVDRGPRRFPALLTIEAGIATKIELQSRN